MNSRVASAAVAIGLLLGALAGGTTSATAEPAGRAAPPKTELTLKVKGCEGCELRLTQASVDPTKIWQSKGRTVTDGIASWSIPTQRTHGLSITVFAPWDGGSGAVPAVVFRYEGLHVGDAVTNDVARHKKHASSCWAGTDQDAFTLPITVVRAKATDPAGHKIRTPRAFTPTTRRWEPPMSRVWKGISGTQDAIYCG